LFFDIREVSKFNFAGLRAAQRILRRVLYVNINIRRQKQGIRLPSFQRKLASTEGVMNRRKFMKQSLAAGVGASGALRLDVAKAFAADAPTGGRSVTLAAKPAPISIDLAKTVVMVVDMQNDFGSKGGMFDRAGLDISIIQRAVPPTAKVLAAARSAGIRIVYLKMGFRPDLSDMGAPDSPNYVSHQAIGVGTAVRAPNGAESRILVQDTWNTEIVDDLRPQPSDIVLYKHRYSEFFETDLDDRLKWLGTRSIIFTGCTTSVCVESTLRDAMFHDYSPVLLADCSGEVVGYKLPRSNHEASLLLIEDRFGWVSTSEEFVKALQVTAKASA
jgi:ureidoacrylate peracid hydrolase